MSIQLNAKNKTQLSVLSLFTGAGGLDIGLETAGFNIKACIEIDEDARRTLTINRPSWKLITPGDIFKIKPEDMLEQSGLKSRQVTLISGGPPCQPFSKSTYWVNRGPTGLNDPRARTLRAYIKIVKTFLPKVILLENVRGLVLNHTNGRSALDLIQSGLDEINKTTGAKYNLQLLHVNAAHYGVPQIRERIFIIANRDGHEFKIPKPTYGFDIGQEPYRTSWDAIGDLDEDEWPAILELKGKWADLLKSIPEGKNYLWHTPRGEGMPLFGWRTKYWSFLLKLAKSKPSWTIQASPGPASGPFHWRNRLLSIEELCRLQTFPKGYNIVGNRLSTHRQIGNAVPCAIGELLGLEIRRQFLDEPGLTTSLNLIPTRRANCPPPLLCEPVSKEYYHLRGNHADHPGVGLGPGKRNRKINELE